MPSGIDPATASESDVFKAFTSAPAADPPNPEPPATPAAEAKPEPETPAPATEIPEQFLGLEKNPDEPDPLAEARAILQERPKGPIKHDNFQRQQDAANRLVADLETRLKAAEQRAEEAAKTSGAIPEDFTKQHEAMKAELEDYRGRLERHAVTETPKFKAQFTDRETAIAERLNTRAKELGVDADTVDAALRSGFKRRLDLLDGLEISESGKAALSQIMDQHDAIQQEKQSFLAKSKEELGAWQAQERQLQEARDKERTDFEERTFTAVSEEMRKTFAPFQRVEGNSAWNQQAELLETEAKKYFNGQMPLKDLAEVVHLGLGARILDQKIVPALRAKVNELSKELASLKVGQPTANGLHPHKAGNAQPQDDANLTPEQRAQATFRHFAQTAYNNGFVQ